MPDGGKKKLVKMRHYILNEVPYWDAVTHGFLVGKIIPLAFHIIPMEIRV